MWGTWVQSLVQEDPPGEGNGNALQYSGLENPMDRGVWWATVKESQTDMTERITLFWKLNHEIMVSDESGSGESPLPGCRVLTSCIFI